MLLFVIIMAVNAFLGTDAKVEKETGYKNSLTGIITKSCILISLIPIFVCTTSFFMRSGQELTNIVKAEETDQVYNELSSVEEDMKNTSEAYDAAVERVKRMRADDWNLILVNKQHPIPEDYEVPLANINPTMQCDERILKDLQNMLSAAYKDGVSIYVASPYRPRISQEKLFELEIRNRMKEGMSYSEAYIEASHTVTIPGSSEHQIGLAVDLLTSEYNILDENFDKTEAFNWLVENCCKYGFILRYPKDKADITGISYEPWHYRYVGKEAAEIIMKDKITLEEFHEMYLKR